MKHDEPMRFERTFPMFFDEGWAKFLWEKHPDGSGSNIPVVAEHITGCARRGAKFDCKNLAAEFVYDTGLERLEELGDSGEVVKLPFDECVFEFNDAVIFASNTNEFVHGDEAITDELLERVNGNIEAAYAAAGVKRYDSVEFIYVDFDGSISMEMTGHFESRALHEASDWKKEDGEDTEYDPIVIFNGEDDMRAQYRRYGVMLLGVLTLMEERLLRQERAGPSQATTEKRRRKGKRTFQTYHVLTLNLAEVKRRTRNVPLRKHESPKLHWRRGHWRTLGRLSEFERQTWVRRCLVGDPAKGFAAKHYNVTWRPTLH